MSADEVKATFLGTARQDASTGVIGPEGHQRWGHGKLDTHEAILEITGSTSSANHLTTSYYLYPNPAQDMIYVVGEMDGSERYILSRLDGSLVTGGKLQGSLKLPGMAKGMYLLSIENRTGVRSFKVIVTD
jgi:hypothetical protein